jgi:hypothetical protein
VGINLATADTVIIMDPDFNPHQDIQALSRAHRIGQKKKVLVFQIMTRESAEEKIMQIGKKKMALDHVLIEKMDADEDEGVDLESILKHGAEALFENDTTGDVHYDAESVEKLLDRSQAENTQVGNDASAESQFSFARVWANDNAALEDRLGDSEAATPVNNTLWEKILAERQKAADEEALANAQALGRGKRKRTAVNYSAKDKEDEQLSPGGTKRAKVQAESDGEFHAKEASSQSDDDDEEAMLEFEQTKKVKGRDLAIPETNDVALILHFCSSPIQTCRPQQAQARLSKWQRRSSQQTCRSAAAMPCLQPNASRRLLSTEARWCGTLWSLRYSSSRLFASVSSSQFRRADIVDAAVFKAEHRAEMAC